MEDDGEIITVIKGKGTVKVMRWGTHPLGYEKTKRGNAIIASGMLVETKSDGEVWFGETCVEPISRQVTYRFRLKRDRKVQSGWHPNPTAAYKEANFLARNQNFNKGSNGQLIIGITYENIQTLLKQKLAISSDQVQEATSFKKMMKRKPGSLKESEVLNAVQKTPRKNTRKRVKTDTNDVRKTPPSLPANPTLLRNPSQSEPLFRPVTLKTSSTPTLSLISPSKAKINYNTSTCNQSCFVLDLYPMLQEDSQLLATQPLVLEENKMLQTSSAPIPSLPNFDFDNF